MSFQTLTFHKKDGIALIELVSPIDDPSKITQLAYDLEELCAEVPCDEQARVILLTGAGGKTFSMEAGLREGEKRTERPFSEVITKIDRPVIAAITGDAIGQGLELALACDIRIASETSRFGLPQIKSGMMPWGGGTQRLSRLVGKGKALEMILTGEVIEAQEALRIGLVNRIVPPEKLVTAAMDMAKEMASKGPIALKYAKEAIYKGMDMTLEQGLRLEADLYLLIHTTKDRIEGIKAFREKRVQKFEGE
jgi:enoyl-CoA hydratase